ncbi:MAG: RDD family protein [Puniceicoccaceae bacterium]
MEYIEAHVGRRAAALIINYFSLTAIIQLLIWFSITDQYSIAIVTVAAVIVSTYTYQSPGKWLMKLRVLNDDNSMVAFRNRLIRNIPIILYFALIVIPGTLLRGKNLREDGNPVSMVIGLLVFGLLLLVLCNYLTIFFNRYGKSLLDMRLGTVVKKIEPENAYRPIK